MRGSAVVVCAVLCGVVALATPGVATADVGFRGPAYGAGTSGSPSGTKPESKLWWNDGFWWASMFSPATGSYSIFRLNMRTQTWSNTGVQIDTRDSTDLSFNGDLTFALAPDHELRVDTERGWN